MGCPWDSFAQAPPGFCEEALCAWIREPGNTWSNLAFVFVAIAMYREARGEQRHLRRLAHITLATGIGSAFYHASGTALGEAADYVGMQLGAAFMLTASIRRWTHLRGGLARALFWVLFAAAMIPGVLAPVLLRPFYAVDGSLCSASELVLYFTHARARSYRWLWITWMFFAPAMILWTLDIQRIWCTPERHWISGHALWHVLNAAGFLAAFRYYAQFEELKDPAPNDGIPAYPPETR